MNILISGGTGFVGSHLRTLLLRQGHMVTVLTRSPGDYESETAKNQQFISWDDDLAGAAGKADAVINLAGTSIFNIWTDQVKRNIRTSRIESTVRLVNAMGEADDPPEVFLSASAVGYYGDAGDRVVDEESDPGDDFMAEICVEWEREARKAEQHGVRVATTRFGIVLEKGGGAMQIMLPPFRMFVGGPIGSGEQYFSWIHMYDLCRALVFLMENRGLEGAFNVTSPQPVTLKTFVNVLGDVMNRPSFFRVPERVLKLIMGEASDPLLNILRVMPKRLQEAGFDFRYSDPHDALSDIVA